jgi:hypothetical protein
MENESQTYKVADEMINERNVLPRSLPRAILTFASLGCAVGARNRAGTSGQLLDSGSHLQPFHR